MSRRTVLAGLLAAASLAAAAAHAHADDPPYDDWNPGFIGFASNVKPDPEADCDDGSRACIDRTISEMHRRFHTVIPVCGHNVLFSAAYIRVTEDVRAAVDAGEFPDTDWLQRWDAQFARLYFTSYDNFRAGRRELLPPVWRIAYDAGRDKSVSAFGNFLLSMNGHIQRDMAFSLYHTGLVGKSGQSQYEPFTAYNRRLAALYAPVLEEFAHRFDETIDDVDLLPGVATDDDAALQLLYNWREVSWRNAERLAAARTDADRRAVARSIEDYALAWANLIYAGTSYKRADDPARKARDARCARYGGQDPAWREVGGVARPAFGKRGARLTRGGARRDTIRLLLRCGAESRCNGTLTFDHRRRRLGALRFAVAAGATQTIRLPVAGATRRLLARRAGRLPARLTVLPDPAPGRAPRASVVRRVTLRVA